MPKINSDSLIFRIGNKVFDVIAVSLLWFVCSIPVITAGASTTALYDTVFKNIRQNRGYCYKGFFKCFKENFKNTVPASIIFAILTVVSMWDISLALSGGSVISGYQITFFILWILAMTWAIWTFALTARFENNWKNTLKNGLLMFFAHLPVTLGMAVVFAISAMLVWDFPILTTVLPVVGMLLNSFMLEKVFRKYIEQINRK